ncbi:MAG: hypothetical protein C6W56_09030 [Caldibacillus debilis]|nr:MAG: hypothetical protein C6W56_09030 [Caldibacillus debilis]
MRGLLPAPHDEAPSYFVFPAASFVPAAPALGLSPFCALPPGSERVRQVYGAEVPAFRQGREPGIFGIFPEGKAKPIHFGGGPASYFSLFYI